MIIVVLVLSMLTNSAGLFATSHAQPLAESKIKVETVATRLQIPWEIAFAPDGRIFFTERIGNLRVIDNGTLIDERVGKIDVAQAGEGGLLGLALDPDFEKNHYLYLYYTYSDFLNLYNKVSRFTESNNKISEQKILLDKIPAQSIHDGGRIKFGPDGKLYVTTGDAANPSSSQDLKSLSGKILRINSDGTIPKDNPFADSPIYSYGHRNPQGLAWDPMTGRLVETEHGPSAHDELNLIEPGKNYGWPNVVGKGNDPKYVDPILETGDVTWAPSGASFYDSDKIPEWKGKFFVATLRGAHLEVLQLDNESKVVSNEPIFQDKYGRLRDVAQGPDGYLYILTSNMDGRGIPSPDDDRILRVVPEFGPIASLILVVSIGSVLILSAKNKLKMS